MKRSPLLSIFLIVLVDIMGLTIIIPLLPFYAESMGASAAVVGFLLGSYALCQLISGPILGHISDKVGRKPVLLVSQFGTLIGFLILAFSTTLPFVFLARVIDGVTAGNLSVAQAYIVDVTEPHNRAKSFAVIGISFGVGFLLGPAISALLAGYGHQYPIFLAAFLSALSILGTKFLLPDPPKISEAAAAEHTREFEWPWQRTQAAFKNPQLAPLLIQFFFFIFAFAVFITGFALFAERRLTYNGQPFGVREVGYAFAYVGVLGALVQGGLIGWMVKRFGEINVIRAGFVTMFLGAFILGWVRTVPLLLVALTISMFGTSVLRPCITSLITQRIGKHEQGSVLGITQSLNSISQIVAPVFSGFLIDHHLLAWWAWTAAISSAIGLWLSFGKA